MRKILAFALVLMMVFAFATAASANNKQTVGVDEDYPGITLTVNQLPGNQNELVLKDAGGNVIGTQLIANNAAGTATIGGYTFNFDTKGNTQIRAFDITGAPEPEDTSCDGQLLGELEVETTTVTEIVMDASGVQSEQTGNGRFVTVTVTETGELVIEVYNVFCDGSVELVVEAGRTTPLADPISSESGNFNFTNNALNSTGTVSGDVTLDNGYVVTVTVTKGERNDPPTVTAVIKSNPVPPPPTYTFTPNPDYDEDDCDEDCLGQEDVQDIVREAFDDETIVVVINDGVED